MEKKERIEQLQRKAGFYDANDMEYSESLKKDSVAEGLGLVSDMLSSDKM